MRSVLQQHPPRGIMSDNLEAAVQSWIRRTERELRGLQEAGDTEELRDTLDVLSKQIRAWEILYEPPLEDLRDSPHRVMPFSSRTVGG